MAQKQFQNRGKPIPWRITAVANASGGIITGWVSWKDLTHQYRLDLHLRSNETVAVDKYTATWHQQRNKPGINGTVDASVKLDDIQLDVLAYVLECFLGVAQLAQK